MQVILIMTDGMRPDALAQCNTPTLDSFMQRASVKMAARSVIPSMTLPCHTSIFHSVPPSRHGILVNEWQPMAQPVTGLVEQLKQHGKRSAVIHNWDVLRDIYRPGHLYQSFFVDTGYDLDGDEIIAEMAVPHIQSKRTDFTFVYFASMDVAGHEFGWMSPDYLKQVELVDGLLAQVLAAVDDDSVVILHSDHGGHDRTHGTEKPEDMLIPWMIAGAGIRAGYEIQADVSLLNTAPMVAHLLGVPAAPQWEGRVLDEVFA